jgi:hypothetical protein
MPVILATQEAQIRRIMIQSQPGVIVWGTLSQKTHHKKRASGVAQSVDHEFKSQCCKKQTKNDQVLNYNSKYKINIHDF